MKLCIMIGLTTGKMTTNKKGIHVTQEHMFEKSTMFFKKMIQMIVFLVQRI